MLLGISNQLVWDLYCPKAVSNIPHNSTHRFLAAFYGGGGAQSRDWDGGSGNCVVVEDGWVLWKTSVVSGFQNVFEWDVKKSVLGTGGDWIGGTECCWEFRTN